MYSGNVHFSAFGVVGLSDSDGITSNAEWKDASEIAVIGSAIENRFASDNGCRSAETTVLGFSKSAAKGFTTSFATLITTSNFDASSRVGSKYR
jgi:hypothetical protein